MLPDVTIMLSVRKFSYILLVAVVCVSSCTNIECPLNNVVQMGCGLYDTDGATFELSDTLSVRAPGAQAALLNGASGISSFAVQLSYEAGVDTLLLFFADREHRYGTDTLFVTHDSAPHFESVDCPMVFFHRITDTRISHDENSTYPYRVSGVELTEPSVNYDEIENLKVYISPVSD